MTNEQLDKGIKLSDEIIQIESAIYALEKMQDKHGERVCSCFLVPHVKEVLLNVLNVRLKVFKNEFEQL